MHSTVALVPETQTDSPNESVVSSPNEVTLSTEGWRLRTAARALSLAYAVLRVTAGKYIIYIYIYTSRSFCFLNYCVKKKRNKIKKGLFCIRPCACLTSHLTHDHDPLYMCLSYGDKQSPQPKHICIKDMHSPIHHTQTQTTKNKQICMRETGHAIGGHRHL